MIYNQLGKAGIKVSELSYGAWVTFSKQLDQAAVNSLIKEAVDHGINFFDNAEAYAGGKAEELMGIALKDYPREQLVVSTKLFFGRETPNEYQILSRKHLIEGIDNSLKRLQMDYVDILFCHRADLNTPIEETVRAMDQIIRDGKAFYWGTSEWPADKIKKAYQIANAMHCIAPSVEQPQYNMFNRKNLEQSLDPLCVKEGMGITTWSPLALGILSGKYNKEIPKNSRLSQETWLQGSLTQNRIDIVYQLEPIAKYLHCTLAQLAIAWCLKNPHVSTVILGATRSEQLQENLKSIKVKAQLNTDVIEEINHILANYQEI